MTVTNPTVDELVEQFHVSHDQAVDIVQDVAETRARDAAHGLPVCSRCGCTQNAACLRGCGWHQLLPEPICTACAS